MIQQVTNKPAVKAFILLFVLSLIGGSVTTASAQYTNSIPVNLHVKYVGENNGQPIYNIQFDNQDKQVQSFFIKDADGTELYSESINSNYYSKRFQLNLGDINVSGLIVSLMDANGKESNYVVNHKTTNVDDVEVIKL